MEIWKDIKGYEGLYQISNFGSVKSLSRVICNNGGIYTINEKILKPSNNGGYLQVVLQKDSKIKTIKVHRLVAEAFILNPEGKPQVNHINGIKGDNTVDNLEWSSIKENVQHAWLNGLNKPNNGAKNGNSKLTQEQVLEIRASNLSSKKLSKIYKISKSAILQIKKRKTWLHI